MTETDDRPGVHAKTPSRRGFLARIAMSAGAMAAALPLVNRAGPAQAQLAVRLGSAEMGLSYPFEVTRTEAEWRARLTDDEYYILREVGTEAPKSHPLWNEERAGSYSCKGCDLTLYPSEWKVPLDKGWVFFDHSIPNTVMTDLDLGSPYAGNPEMQEVPSEEPLIELHCRRCGSHLGHLVSIGGPIHCINGLALTFRPRAA